MDGNDIPYDISNAIGLQKINGKLCDASVIENKISISSSKFVKFLIDVCLG